METCEGRCHQGMKRKLLSGGSPLSDIPSHFNLGKARTASIKGFAQESQREKETWNTGPHVNNSQGSFVLRYLK